MNRINLNADMGEWFGGDKETAQKDAALFANINSASIACGGHSGDAESMRATCAAAKLAGVSIGAHPSFYDLENFGRVRMQLPPPEIYKLITEQLQTLAQIAEQCGAKITHIKPHGALNNMACEDAALADIICDAAKVFDARIILLAPALSQLAAAGERAALATAHEIYADRAYNEDATLLARQQPGAMITDPTTAVQRVLEMLERGGIITASGKLLPCPIHSICTHADTKDSLTTTKTLKQSLTEHHTPTPLPEMNLG